MPGVGMRPSGDEAYLPVSVGRADETVDAHLVDVGGLRLEPRPLVWVGWEGVLRGNLLAPDAAAAYGLHLIRLAALAGGEPRP